MNKVWRILLLSASLVLPAGAAEDPPAPAPGPPPSGEYKLKIELFGVQKVPVARAELLVREGVAYQFITEFPEEVTILEPGQDRVHLLDLRRKVRTTVSAPQIDTGLGQMRQRAAARIDRQIKAGGRANRVSAAMTRDLFEPQFQTTYVAATHRLSLTNPTVEIEAVGEPEPDAGRRKTIQKCLATLAKLDAIREPEEVQPPFGRLHAYATIADGYRLRPTEITVLYRLAGTLRRWRWTYELVPALTHREREALSRVDGMRRAAPRIAFPRYEAPETE